MNKYEKSPKKPTRKPKKSMKNPIFLEIFKKCQKIKKSEKFSKI